MKWYCTKCNKSVSKLFDLIGAVAMRQRMTDKSKLSTEVTSAGKHIQEFNITITKLDSKVQNLDISSQAQASELQNKVDNAITKQISETQLNQYVAHSRSNNLHVVRVFDITESASPDTATQMNHDNAASKDVLTAINCEQFEIMETHRLGKLLSTEERKTRNIQ